jgi:8-oxo-dGTP pyrophosphatase MutT (NUDIX family)
VYPAQVSSPPNDSAPLVLDDVLRQNIANRLGGFERRPIPPEGRRRAGVAILLVADDAGDACFVLTRRAARLRSHPGQWALPGGRLDGTESPEEAALREAHEEVGLDCSPASVMGMLDDYPTRSGYVITPVVVWAGADAHLTANPAEVAEIHRVPLADLEAPGVPRLREIPESDQPVISVRLVGTHVHAPTAAILYQFRELALRGKPTRVDHFEQPVFAWS